MKMQILEELHWTEEAEIISQVQECYKRIEAEQKDWYEKSQFFCPDGCGSCCHDFEPDLLECESLFMAAWLIENQYENALKIAEGVFPFDNSKIDDGKTCPFHDFSNAYHCSIYGGRPFIFIIFGSICSKSKFG